MEFRSQLSILILSLGLVQCGKTDGYGLSGGFVERDYVYLGNYSSSSISAFLIEDNGTLTRSANTTSSGTGTANINSITASRDSNNATDYIYASHKATNNISSYTISKFFDAAPSQLAFKALTASLPNTSSFTLNPAFPYGYAINTTSTSNNLISFNVNAGMVTTLGTASAHTNPSSISVTKSGQYLYVTNSLTNDVSAFAVNSANGALSAVAGQPFAAGSAPVASQVTNSGSFLYVLNQTAASISGYSIGSGTGVLTNLSLSISVGSNPVKMAISPNDKFLYVTNNGANTISGFAVDATTGALTAMPGSPFTVATQSSPYAVQVSLDGRFLFVSWMGSGNVTSFAIDPVTGALTEISSSANSGTLPQSMVIIRLHDRS